MKTTTDSIVGEILAWPSAMERGAIIKHKSVLIQQADYLASLIDTKETLALQRAVYRGAAVWEVWLLRKSDEGMDADERRAQSALSLAKLAGDLPLTLDVLQAWRSKNYSPSARFYLDAEQRARNLSVFWNQSGEKLTRLYKEYVRTKDSASLAKLHDLGIKLIRSHGLPREVHYFLGRAAIQAGLQDEAARHFTALCIADPFYPLAAGFLADSLAQRSVDLAVEVMRRSSLCNGDDPGHLAYRLKFEWDQWKSSDRSTPPPVELAEQATTAAEQSNKIEPGVISLAHLVAAYVMEAAGRTDEALRVIEAGLQRRPSDIGLRVMHGMLLLSAGLVEKALEEFIKAEASPPDLALVEALLGSTLVDNGKAADGIRHFERAIALSSSSFEAGALTNDLGVALARVGRLEEAKKCFVRAIELLGDDARPRINLELTSRLPVSGYDKENSLVLLVKKDRAQQALRERFASQAVALAA